MVLGQAMGRYLELIFLVSSHDRDRVPLPAFAPDYLWTGVDKNARGDGLGAWRAWGSGVGGYRTEQVPGPFPPGSEALRQSGTDRS